mmetsp:Transcript_1143/g.2622  ORF Transcript_1143/g.2622 Transcript_1143/m.2622 type:complete len:836 (-) Transcript_1143:332-2839(-)|eukprot:CAMPEP_0114494660 /NCGR_PEP_ID=MMETSP0109-20121206/4773_1 /TAXON_ID=29199 /ORGANISM="Chlorarachnion reptans, Strain CCCM449" /LENGTH=835 /DNA_ID=CAMNT_0001671717 /DNA_START=120 /DNA_END=2627 /DNA_ORIENTATION=-
MEGKPQPLNLIIPLGGIGSRFQKEGYMQPKPFVRVLGMGMVRWLIENMQGAVPEDSLVIIYNPKFLTMEQKMQRLAEDLEKKFASVKLVRLPGPTRGAAETVQFGVKALSYSEKRNPCMLLDGDSFYTDNIISKFRKISTQCGASVVFKDTQPKPLYSYVKVPDEKTKVITDIIEKVKISDYANTGCYCFKSGFDLLKYINLIIEKGEQQLSQDMKGEFYTSGVIKAMLRDEHPFQAILVDRNDFFVLGTPVQVKAFCEKKVKTGNQPKRFCFDLDHTLVTGPKAPGAYETCKPIELNIHLCNWLHKLGHTIIIQTARRMRTHKAVVGKLLKDIGELTLKQLDEFGVKYHEIYFGKPNADFYIGDNFISCLDDVPKELGFYPPRDINDIKYSFTKPSKNTSPGAEEIGDLTPLNLIVPLGGIGSRFQKQGYTQPKPFVRVLGKPMLNWLLDSFKKIGAKSCDSVVLIYNPKFLSMERNMRDLLDYFSHDFNDVKLVHLPGPTRGAAETVQYGVKALSEGEKSNPCMLLDGDCFYTTDIVTKYRKVAKGFGASIVFHDTQPKPIYSYVKVKDEKSMEIDEIVEKVKISDYANTGCYCFRSGVELLKYIDLIIANGEQQLSQDMKGEFYTSGVIKAMLRDNVPFKAIQVSKSDFAVLGTPAQVKHFCAEEKSLKKIEARRFCFDLDSLFSAPSATGSYETCKPLPRMINFVNDRHKEGHYIIIQSSRGLKEAGGNVYVANKACAEISLLQLREAKVNYHEIMFSKPYADFYIDDKSVNALEDLEKCIGYYSPNLPTGRRDSCGEVTPYAGSILGIFAVATSTVAAITTFRGLLNKRK